MYTLDREGVPLDYDEAVKWFRLAAGQGHANAQNNLGLMYEIGKGVPQDYVQAHMWFALAAANSADIDSAEKVSENRDIVAKLMTPNDISEAQRLAREWLEEHGE